MQRMARSLALAMLALSAAAVVSVAPASALGPDGTGYYYNCYYYTYNCATNTMPPTPSWYGPGGTELTVFYGKPFTNNQTTGTSKGITMYVSGSAVWSGTASTQIFVANTAMYAAGPEKKTRYDYYTGGVVTINNGWHHG